ncbi:carbohydrate kinase [Christensenellaceae bacterium]|nr:carbohydrate kinase [Christensenellaceae bacterium]BDF59921.1 carbohydrate kinase [Christensenellaceae bacterium]
MKEKYLIGIDSGTSRIKAVLFDLDGNELHSKGMAITAYTPYEDWYEQDMNEIWELGVQCLKTVSQGIDPDDILGIGLTAQGDGLWMIDKQGKPVRKGICFCDGRTSEIIRQWDEDGTRQKAFDICGTAVFGSSMSAEIRWMERHEPQALKNAEYFFHLKDWLFYKLTDTVCSDDTDMCIPMLNVKTREYDDRLFELFGIMRYKDRMPKMRTVRENKAMISPEAAKTLGFSEKTLITGGPMDIGACMLSCGVTEDGQAMSIIGTAAIHAVVMDEPDIKPHMLGMTLAHFKQDRWIRMMSSLCGAPNLEWFLDTLGDGLKLQAQEKGVDIYDYCSEIIRDVPIGANGVVYYPYLLAGGERAPFFKSNIKASFLGISFNTRIEEMLRAVYEGVALAMFDCYSSVPTPLKEIYVSGGGSKSDVWMQIFADMMGKEIIVCNGKEHGARGAAMNCGVAAGVFSGYDEAVRKIVKVKKRYKPDTLRHKRYMELYEIYRSGYRMNMDWWDLRSHFLDK